MSAERALVTRPEPVQEAAPAAFAAGRAVSLHAVSALGFPRHNFAAIPVRPQLQRQPNGEDPAIRARRLAAANGARNAVERIRRGLSNGLLWPTEVAVEGGVLVGGTGGSRESLAEREARLRRLATDLGQLASELDATTLTDDRLKPQFDAAGSGWDIGGGQPWQDVLVLYTHRQAELGVTGDLIFLNHMYIETDPDPRQQVPRALVPRPTDTGIYLIVEDPVNEPLRYQRLTGFEGFRRGVIVTVWVDDFGYFYYSRGKKIYLPGRP